jgi:hypothetical protein
MKRLTYEFNNISEVLIDDPAEWQPLKVVRDTYNFELCRPVSDSLSVSMPLSSGNQILPINYSLMRVSLLAEQDQPDPEWMVAYSIVKCCLSWIRIVTRQYWIGILPTPSVNFPRVTIMAELISGDVTFTGAGAFSSLVIPLRLSHTVWDALTPLLQTGVLPQMSESFLCDALLHFAGRDYVQAVAGLGIACELELNSFIEDLLQLHPETVRKMYKINRLQFSEKLRKIPTLLGTSDFKRIHASSFAKVSELYESRGRAVHTGQASTVRKDNKTDRQEIAPLSVGLLAGYWFAAEDFFEWTRRERTRLGIWKENVGAVYHDLDTQRMKMVVVGP